MAQGDPGSLDQSARERGYIGVWRQIRQHPYWREPERLWAFLDLNMDARFVAGWVLWKPGPHRATRIWTPRGALCTSTNLLTEKWREVLGWSRSAVDRFLQNAQDAGELYRLGCGNPPESLDMRAYRRECARIGLQPDSTLGQKSGQKSPLLTIVNYDLYNPPAPSVRDRSRDGSGIEVGQKSGEVPMKSGTYGRNKNGVRMLEPTTPHRTAHDRRAAQELNSTPEYTRMLTKQAAEIVDAHQRATSNPRPPSPREMERAREAIKAYDGPHTDIVEYVFRVTAEAIRKGSKIGSVSYGLAAWERRDASQASREPNRHEPDSESGHRAYHEPYVPKPVKPMTDAESESAIARIQAITGRIGSGPSTGPKK